MLNYTVFSTNVTGAVNALVPLSVTYERARVLLNFVTGRISVPGKTKRGITVVDFRSVARENKVFACKVF